MYMKPYDGGGWRGVSRVQNADELHLAYDSSGGDAHAPAGRRRGLRRVRPGPVDRRGDDGDALRPGRADALAATVSSTDFSGRHRDRGGDDLQESSTRSSAGNSTPARCSSKAATSSRSTTPTPARTCRSPRCTTTSRGRCATLVKWTVFCLATGRRQRIDLDTRAYFDISRPRRLDYDQKLAAIPEAGRSVFRGRRVSALLRGHICRTSTARARLDQRPGIRPAARRHSDGHLPAHERERFIAHFRGLVALWAQDEAGRLRA